MRGISSEEVKILLNSFFYENWEQDGVGTMCFITIKFSWYVIVYSYDNFIALENIFEKIDRRILYLQRFKVTPVIF